MARDTTLHTINSSAADVITYNNIKKSNISIDERDILHVHMFTWFENGIVWI